MDIISHTLTGVALGTVAATISNESWKGKSVIILAGALGGALPDLDAVSLWEKFDRTIGSFLDLSHSGKEIYFGKFWYSHHAALHSLLAPIVLILLSILIKAGVTRSFKGQKILGRLKKNRFITLSFFFGFFFHLLEDMPTPASVWGGVNLFFPSSNYVGGFGNIWWWNNYDLFLIILLVIVFNLLINTIPARYYKAKARSSLAIFLAGVALYLVQINTRPVDFLYSGHTNKFNSFEVQSMDIQKEILGDHLYQIMVDFDNKLPLHF